MKQLLRLVCVAAFGMLAISIVSAFPLLESLGFSPSDVSYSAYEGSQYEHSLLAWVDDYKLELTLAMFMV
ncbi:MAG: hypothetical protein U1C59_08530, partial [Methylotenera sp.]|nr:hypothetical protein [Methylotenera sp.]